MVRNALLPPVTIMAATVSLRWNVPANSQRSPASASRHLGCSLLRSPLSASVADSWGSRDSKTVDRVAPSACDSAVASCADSTDCAGSMDRADCTDCAGSSDCTDSADCSDSCGFSTSSSAPRCQYRVMRLVVNRAIKPQHAPVRNGTARPMAISATPIGPLTMPTTASRPSLSDIAFGN